MKQDVVLKPCDKSCSIRMSKVLRDVESDMCTA